MRFVFVMLVVLLSGCAASIHTEDAFPSSGIVVDPTGADIPIFNSLPRRYAVPPTLTHMELAPLPIPGAVGKTFADVVFSVDEHGNITRISLRPMADRQYQRRFVESLRLFKFRPATTTDGQGVASYYLFRMEF